MERDEASVGLETSDQVLAGFLSLTSQMLEDSEFSTLSLPIGEARVKLRLYQTPKVQVDFGLAKWKRALEWAF
jgi:hypothetical protein